MSCVAVQFVSSFTDNNLSGEQLAKAYLRLNRSQAAQDDGSLQPSLHNIPDEGAFDEEVNGSCAYRVTVLLPMNLHAMMIVCA